MEEAPLEMRSQDFDKRKNTSLTVRDKEDTHGYFILVFQKANLKLLLQQTRFSREPISEPV